MLCYVNLQVIAFCKLTENINFNVSLFLSGCDAVHEPVSLYGVSLDPSTSSLQPV